jgi:hypothetical protein
MAKASPQGSPQPRVRAENDIYTLLLAIALALVLGAIGFVIYRTYQLLGSAFPGFA